MTGSSMQSAAVLWHVNELSGEPIALGGVGLFRIVPILVFSLIAGAAADAFNRRRLMFFTQIGMASLAALLGWLTLRGLDSIGLIYLIIAISSAISAFDLPARQSLVPNLVPQDALTNAFSLNSIAFQFGSIVGPTIGGIILAEAGIAYAYLINAISFLAVIVALILMGPVPQERKNIFRKSIGSQSISSHLSKSDSDTLMTAVKQGLNFVLHEPIILSSMLLDFFATFFSSATFLLPIFAKDILAAGVKGYGWLVAAPSFGAGFIALVLSFRKTIQRQGPVLLTAVAGFGLATIVFGLSRSFWLTFFALAMTGVTDCVSAIIRNTIRQIQTPDHLRGRMTSVNQIFFMGGPQLGELEAGLVGQWLGVPFAVVSGGIGCLLALAWITIRFPQLRRYQGNETIVAGRVVVYPKD
jgi:MFS family permease